MAGDESIKTQFDDILSSLRESRGKAVSAHKLSSVSRMPQADVLKWLSVLERSGHVHIENRLTGIYARWVGPGEKTKPQVEETIDAALSSAAAEPRKIELASPEASPAASVGGGTEKKARRGPCSVRRNPHGNTGKGGYGSSQAPQENDP